MSSNLIDVAELLQQKPVQWGLRGDPHLWQEMSVHFTGTPLPDSAAQLEQLLTQAFETLTGQPITTETPIRVDRFPRSGMSGGMVSAQFWRETAVPLLLSRFSAMA
jgi:hypothetical protein